jgi:hypothetical protein
MSAQMVDTKNTTNFKFLFYSFLLLPFGQWRDLQLFSEVAPLASEWR